MWKITKGTEKDFEGAPESVTVLIDGSFGGEKFFADKFEIGSPYYNARSLIQGGNLYGIYKNGEVVAQREWIEHESNPRRRKPRQKPPVRTQTTVTLIYKEDNGSNNLNYTLKNVVSFVIRSVDKKVNITYKESMGKVVKRVNITIPFSELVGCVYYSPTRKESFTLSEARITHHIKFDLDESTVIQL